MNQYANKSVDNIFVGRYNQGMSGSSLKRATGNWVVGDQFWDREVELALFMERLDEGAHLLLTAPRRIGKTSLMKEAARRMEGRFLCLYVDLQKAESASDAIVELSLAARQYKPAWDRVLSLFQHALKDTVEAVKIKDLSITLRGGLTADNWRSKGDDVFQALAEQDLPVVVFFDEVAILVNRLLRGSDYVITNQRREEVDAFLSWLRANSIRHQGKVRLVVTGSIGLEPLVRQAGLSATLNTFTPFHLAPWERRVAGDCLKALSNGYGLVLRREVVDAMLDRLGVCIPHHVQMFFDHVYEHVRLTGAAEVSVQLVGEVYQQSMLGIRGHVELSHMEERLTMVLGPKLDLLALDLLTEAAVTGTLTTDAARILAFCQFGDDWVSSLRDVLGILEHDGYFSKRHDTYSFASPLLKDWWRARFQFAYVPAAERKL
jgi:hypothetical protein